MHYLDAGVAYLPAGRLEEGLIAGHDDHRACRAGRAQPGVPGRLGRPPQRTAAERIKQYQHQGPARRTHVEELSGGNQQRTLLGLLPPQLELLLMEHPTRGLDLESIEYIWGLLLERTRHGTAIMFASADLDELLDRSDRILVFFSGRVAAARRRAHDDRRAAGRADRGQRPLSKMTTTMTQRPSSDRTTRSSGLPACAWPASWSRWR